MALELRNTDTEPLCKVTMGKREREREKKKQGNSGNSSSFQYRFNAMQTEEKIMSQHHSSCKSPTGTKTVAHKLQNQMDTVTVFVFTH